MPTADCAEQAAEMELVGRPWTSTGIVWVDPEPFQLDRNFLKGHCGDHANPVLTVAGYNLRLVLKWLRKILRQIIKAITDAIEPKSALDTTSDRTTSSGRRRLELATYFSKGCPAP